jgi:hypothetical protein
MAGGGRAVHDEGQVSAEWVMVVVLAAAVAVGLVALSSDPIRGIFESVASVLCRAVGHGCGEPSGTCVVASDSYSAGGRVTYRSLSLDGGGVYRLERRSDGTYEVQWSETGHVGILAGAGRRLVVDAGSVETGHATSAGATLEIGFVEGVVARFTSESAAKAFVRAHATARLADTVAGAMVPIPGAGLALSPADVTRHLMEMRLPPMDRYVAVEAGGSAAAAFERSFGGLEGLVGADIGLRIASDGTRTLYTTMSITAGAALGVGAGRARGVDAETEAVLLGELVLSPDSLPETLTLRADLRGEASGPIAEALLGSAPAKALNKAGTLAIALDLTEPRIRAALVEAGRQTASATGRLRGTERLLEVIRAHGEITWVAYDVESSDWGGTASVGAPSTIGVTAEAEAEHRRVSSAQFFDNASKNWSEWTRCTSGGG